MSSSNDSIQKTITVAVLLCLVCSIIVAGAAVTFKPIQRANKQEDKNRNVLMAAGLLEDGIPVAEQFKKVTTRIVNLREGRFATDAELEDIRAAGLNPEQFDQRKSSKIKGLSDVLDGAEDLAKIKRLEKYAAVYVLAKDDHIDKLILPIHGYGLWSTLYGFLALESDLKTIKGLGFYSHAETPGLGGEVDNPKWKQLWEGKHLLDEQGKLAIRVIKGKAAEGNMNDVDGLSGATLTSRGVNNLVRFWMADAQFGKFLTHLQNKGI